MISIHAPTRGATVFICHKSFKKLKFQSTLPREERRVKALQQRTIGMISIHAPTRGATNTTGWQGTGEIKFQSTLPREERLTGGKGAHGFREFQSTLPREERHYTANGWTVGKNNFNPRSHERSDDMEILLNVETTISIHAPTRGATFPSEAHLVASAFQSTLPREERPSKIIKRLCQTVFQSTLPREERRA